MKKLSLIIALLSIMSSCEKEETACYQCKSFAFDKNMVVVNTWTISICNQTKDEIYEFEKKYNYEKDSIDVRTVCKIVNK